MMLIFLVILLVGDLGQCSSWLQWSCVTRIMLSVIVSIHHLSILLHIIVSTCYTFLWYHHCIISVYCINIIIMFVVGQKRWKWLLLLLHCCDTDTSHLSSWELCISWDTGAWHCWSSRSLSQANAKNLTHSVLWSVTIVSWLLSGDLEQWPALQCCSDHEHLVTSAETCTPVITAI